MKLASLRRTLAVAAKEVRQLGRDRLTLGMVVGVPLVQILIFGYGINLDVRHLHAAAVDYAQTSASRALLASLAASQVVQWSRPARDPAELRTRLASGEIAVGVYIPPDFERRLAERDRPAAQLLIDGTKPGIEPVARALAQVPLPGRPGIAVGAGRAIEPGGALETGRTLEVRTEYNPERRTAVQIVPALIGAILHLTMVVFTAIALVRERERGNLELLITTPVRSLELMVGKLLPYVVVGLVQTTLILAIGTLLFDVPVNGSLVQLYAASALFIAATLALGLVLSTLARTQFQAMQLGFFTMLPSILLSGFMFPFEGMPVAAQWLAQVLPLTHFVDVLRAVILRGADLGSLRAPLAKLAVLFVLAVALAALRFRKRLE